MSRTYKDVPPKHSNPEYKLDDVQILNNYVWWEDGKKYINYTKYIQKPGVKSKKKRHFVEKNLMTTPMWWIHDYMTVPQRAKNTIWEKAVIKGNVEDLDLEDPPQNGRKPHFYYW